MTIKLAEQILLRTNRVIVISVWGKELALALGAGGHSRDFVFIPQYNEGVLCRGGDSLI